MGRQGGRIQGEFLNNLRFADDVVLIANNLSELTRNAEEFLEAWEKAGLSVSTSKTKLLTNVPEREVK